MTTDESQQTLQGHSEVKKFEDSVCVVWHGPRRGGKTASMAHAEGTDLINGKRVFSDNPVEFDYQYHEDGPIVRLKTEPLDYDEIMRCTDDEELFKKYLGCSVAWDEIDKKLGAQEWQSVFNRIFGKWITYVGKMEMNLYMTAQFLSLVTKNFRLQFDSEVFCCDLSFKYPNLERGSCVGQTWHDLSGRSTGELYEMTGREYQQVFNAKTVWPIYNTKHFSASVFDSMQKYEIKREKKVISFGDMAEANSTQANFEHNDITLDHLVAELKELKDTNTQSAWKRHELSRMARQRGFQGTDSALFNKLGSYNVVAGEARGELVLV